MELRPGYKLTEVGVIPEKWEVASIGAFCRTYSGGTPATSRPDYYGGDIAWITSSDLNQGSIAHVDGRITKKGLKYSATKMVDPGTLLMALYGATAGVSAVAMIEAAINQAVLAIIPRSGDTNYLFQYLTHSKDRIIQTYTQGGQPNLSGEIVRSLLLPCPTLPEQHAIAGVLGDVDVLLGGLEKLIAKKRDLKQAAMQQLLTGQTRLPGFSKGLTYRRTRFGQLPEDWHLAPLTSISTMNGRIGWQGLKQEEFTFVDSDPFLITGMNFEHGEIRWDEVYHISEERYEEAKPIQLRSGDILMTKDGTIGKILFVETIPFPGKASLNSHLLVFRPLKESYVPKFLFYQLNSKRFADYVDLNKSGTTFFGITQEAVGNYPACLPSIDEQTAIATVLSGMDAELASLEQRLSKTRALKQGMMQELLTGRTRLI